MTGVPPARTTRQATAHAALASVLAEAGTTLEEAGATDTSWRP